MTDTGTAILDTIGGKTVKHLACESGDAAGRGDTAGALGYGALAAGDIVLEAFTWGRTGALVGAKKGVAAEATEFSHWIPERFGGPRMWWSGQVVSLEEHAFTDSFRYRFMPRAWKGLSGNALWGPLRQQLNRLPQ